MDDNWLLVVKIYLFNWKDKIEGWKVKNSYYVLVYEEMNDYLFKFLI